LNTRGEDMPKQSNYKRRIFLVKRTFQLKYASIITALFGLASFIVWWEMYQQIRGLYDRGIIADPEIFGLLLQISQIVLLKLAIALLLIWFLAILLSHFIAGPLYRLEKSLGILRSGDLTHRLFFRKRDQIQGMASHFNEAMDELHKIVSEDRVKLDRAIKKLAAAKVSQETIDDLKSVNKRFTI
jgi:methyl-accepting chemotaxis protein